MSVPATVLATDSAGVVEVELAGARPCAGCEGACLWRRLPQAARARLPAAMPLAVGDSVLVCMPPGHLLLAAALLHGLPWVAVVLGAIAGYAVTGSDGGSLVGVLAALAVALAAGAALRGRLEHWLLGRLVILRAAT